jgi:prephenate dehydratase
MSGVPPARYAFLGPEGTFTEAALLSIPAAARGRAQAHATVASALDAVRRGEADAAMVPLENSTEGSVAATVDDLAFGEPLIITREVLLPVTFALVTRPGTALCGVRRVGTHPHAAAQCRRWLRSALPEVEIVPWASTAAAAAALTDPAAGHDAAIAAPLVVERYRLALLADDIGDVSGAVTRFVLVSRPSAPPRPTGADRTSLVAFIADDHPGALLEVLGEFASRGVNLTRIESRPTGERLGRYCFSVDCEGHVADEAVGSALGALRQLCADIRFLGSYPRGDAPRGGDVEPGRRERRHSLDGGDAAVWLARVRSGGAG